MTTINERVHRAQLRLRDAGIPAAEARLDARLLAEFVLGWDATRFFTTAHELEPAEFGDRYEGFIERRERREPLAYITRRREFWGLEFEVSPDVLIPRPETELIVETALELLPERARPLAIADVCTGSGCLAVALAREYSSARLTATDLSAPALAVARRNASFHGLADRITFMSTDLLCGVLGPFDLIVSNPPYVPERDRDTLQPEVRDFEPSLALFVGHDGLDVVRQLVEQAAPTLAGNGLLLVEIGQGQAVAVEELISKTPSLTMVGLRRDLQGIPRLAVARKD